MVVKKEFSSGDGFSVEKLMKTRIACPECEEKMEILSFSFSNCRFWLSWLDRHGEEHVTDDTYVADAVYEPETSIRQRRYFADSCLMLCVEKLSPEFAVVRDRRRGGR